MLFRSIDKSRTVTVIKEWIGEHDIEVLVHLYADGIEIRNQILNEDNDWKTTFEDLQVYNHGKLINYTVDETQIVGYVTEIIGDMDTGFKVINTIDIRREVVVKKEWVGKSYDEVVVHLFADGIECDKQILNENNHWTTTFTNLPIYKEGQLILYSGDETEIIGYATEIIGNMDEGFTIINTFVQVRDVTVQKEWVGEASDEVTVHLYADGKKVSTDRKSVV